MISFISPELPFTLRMIECHLFQYSARRTCFRRAVIVTVLVLCTIVNKTSHSIFSLFIVSNIHQITHTKIEYLIMSMFVHVDATFMPPIQNGIATYA